MTDWTDDDLRRIGDADKLQISSRRADGTLRPYVTIWAVRDGDDLGAPVFPLTLRLSPTE